MKLSQISQIHLVPFPKVHLVLFPNTYCTIPSHGTFSSLPLQSHNHPSRKIRQTDLALSQKHLTLVAFYEAALLAKPHILSHNALCYHISLANSCFPVARMSFIGLPIIKVRTEPTKELEHLVTRQVAGWALEHHVVVLIRVQDVSEDKINTRVS